MAARDSGRVSASIVLGCAALAIAIAALVVAVTRSSTTRVVTAPTTTTIEATCASSAGDLASFIASVHSQGHAAYASQPIRITGNGAYTLLFGPLTSHDAARFTSSMSSGFSFPITNHAFSPNVDRGETRKVTISGATYVQARMVVSDFTASCSALRALLQY
jgi:hypothetical protein